MSGGAVRRWLRELLPPLSMVLLALVAVARVLPELRTRVVGDAQDIDLTGHLWHCWWFGHSLLSLGNPYTCEYVLFPAGSPDLLVKSGPAVNAALTTPFQPLLGVIGSYNALLVVLLALGGYGAFLLARHLTGDQLASWLAGFLAMANPYVLFEASVGRMDQASVGWLFLALLAFLRLLERPGVRRGVVAALATFAATISYLGYGQILMLALAGILVGRLASQRRWPDRDTLVGLGSMGGVFLLLMSPLLWTFGSSMVELDATSVQHVSLPFWLGDEGQLTEVERVISRGSAPLASFLLTWGGRDDARLILPLTVLALAALGAVRNPRARTWVVLALVFLVLSLGPYLRLRPMDDPSAWPMPAILLYDFVPTMSRMRFPSRFLVMVWASLIVLVAYGLAGLRQWLGRRSWVPWVLVGAAALTVAEPLARGVISLPLPSGYPPRPSTYYSEALAQHPHYAIVSVPIATGKPTPEEEAQLPVSWQALEMYYQSIHQHPILNGAWVSFQPPVEHTTLLAENALLASIIRLQQGEEPVEGGAQAAKALRQAGFSQVVVNRSWLLPARLDPIEDYLSDLLGPPRYFRDGDISVYALGPEGLMRTPVQGVSPGGRASGRRPTPSR